MGKTRELVELDLEIVRDEPTDRAVLIRAEWDEEIWLSIKQNSFRADHPAGVVGGSEGADMMKSEPELTDIQLEILNYDPIDDIVLVEAETGEKVQLPKSKIKINRSTKAGGAIITMPMRLAVEKGLELMSEITSFNQLFFEAAQRGLRLNSFHQLPNRNFRANWRTDDNRFHDAAEHERPFDCLLRAYLIATGQPLPKAAQPGVVEDNWFE